MFFWRLRENCPKAGTQLLYSRISRAPDRVFFTKVRVRQTHTDDQQLIQIVDSALADAARRSGDWLVCRPGCTQCCIGVFSINQLDAWRLRQGLADLERVEPEHA